VVGAAGSRFATRSGRCRLTKEKSVGAANYEDKANDSLGALVLTAGFCVGASCAYTATLKAARQEAIEAGVARYVADPATGQTRFEYGVSRDAP
jgi:hypothetical protein